MNKNAIVTIMTGFDPSYRFALKSFEQYAKKTGSDLKVIESPQISIKGLSRFNFSKIAWAQKFLLKDFLEEYERVLYVDADIIIHPNSPNIFEFYPDNEKVYMFNEGMIENRAKEYNDIGKILTNIDVPLVSGKMCYFNAGVILFSRESNYLKLANFNEVEKICNNINFYEQTYFNYLIFKNKMNYGFLDSKFNRMIISGKAEDRFDSYFIHHAGGSYSSRSKFRFLTLIKDYCLLNSYQLNWFDYLYILGTAFGFYIRRYTKKLLS